MSIFYRVWSWIGERRRDIIVFTLIFLLCSLSFGLGYLVNQEYTHAPIVIQKVGNN